MTLQQLIDITNILALLLQDHNFNDVHIDFISNFINCLQLAKIRRYYVVLLCIIALLFGVLIGALLEGHRWRSNANVPYRIESFNRLYKVIDNQKIEELLNKNIII